MRLLLSIISSALFLAACHTYSDEQKTEFASVATEYSRRKGYVMSETSSGLLIKIEEPGNGETIQYTSELTLEYTGKLTNGTTVDESRIGAPLRAELRSLIAGFQEGLLGQKAGVKVHLIIPPHLGYGDEQTGKIPPNSVLDFRIHVLSVN